MATILPVVSDSEDDIEADFFLNDEVEDDEPALYVSKNYKDLGVSLKNSRELVNNEDNQKRAWVTVNDDDDMILLDDIKAYILQGNLNSVTDIFEKDIDVDIVLKSGWTPLMYAASHGHFEIVQFLLEKGANPNFFKDTFTPLMAACACQKDDEDTVLKCVESLLKFGADVNSADKYYMTTLMFAAQEGRESVVNILLHHEAKVNVQDVRGWTPLIFAASRGHGHIVRVLLDVNADPNKICFNGEAAIDIALASGYSVIVNLLKNAGSRSAILESTTKSAPEKSSTDSSYGDLEIFIYGLDLESVLPIIKEHCITFADFLEMTEPDLEKIGITQFGVRKKLLEAISDIHKKPWEMSSLPQLQKKHLIRCGDGMYMVNCIIKHLIYIKSSIVFLKKTYITNPSLLEVGQNDAVNVKKFKGKVSEAVFSLDQLRTQLLSLEKYLDKVKDNVEYQPADLIVEKKIQSKKKFNLMIGIGTLMIIIGGILWKNTKSFQNLKPFKLPFNSVHI